MDNAGSNKISIWIRKLASGNVAETINFLIPVAANNITVNSKPVKLTNETFLSYVNFSII